MIGVTSAYLNLAGKCPVARDVFTICAIEGASSSKQSFSRGVGMGSSEQVVDADRLTILVTSSIDAGVKVDI